MPTGYTHGVIEGKIKTFPDFAKTCMRAFGACIHLREESSEKKYEPSVPSDYYSKQLAQAIKDLETAKSISDKQIVATEFKKRAERKKYLKKQIAKIKKQKIKLDAMLDKVVNWTPPTSEHTEFRRFMMEQLETTIKHDGDTDYYEKELEHISKKSVDANVMRQQMIDSATENIEYNTKHRNEEVARCNSANKWVDDLLKSLKN